MSSQQSINQTKLKSFAKVAFRCARACLCLCLCSIQATAVAQEMTPDQAASLGRQDTSGMLASPVQLSAICNQLGDRLSKLEYIVTGERHLNVQALDRTKALEKVVYGNLPDELTSAFSVSERIDRVQSAIMQVARTPAAAGARMPDDNDIEGLRRGFLTWSARLKAVAPPVVTPQAKPLNGIQTPGRNYGYPYTYNGPGLPPASNGAYPGTATWWNSPYRQSGQPFSTNAPFFPSVSNRQGTVHR